MRKSVVFLFFVLSAYFVSSRPLYAITPCGDLIQEWNECLSQPPSDPCDQGDYEAIFTDLWIGGCIPFPPLYY